MIDTIGLKIPLKKHILDKIKEVNYTTWSHKTVAGDKVVRKFESISSKFEIKHESWRSEIQYKLDYDREQIIFLGFSLAKYRYGHNVYMIFNLEKELEIFKSDFENYYLIKLPDLKYWKLTRLDICFNFDVKDYETAVYAMEYIKRLEYPRRQPMIYKTAIHFSSRYYAFKVYLKYDEYFKHDFKDIRKYDYNRAAKILEESKGIIRIEASVRNRAIKQYLQLNIDDVTDYVSPVEVDESFLKEKLNEYIEKFLGGFKLVGNYFLDLKDKLCGIYSYEMARNLLGFYNFLNIYGKDETKKFYSKSTYYKNINKLKNAGVNRFSDDSKEEDNIDTAFDYLKNFEFKVSSDLIKAEKLKII